ncbi:MAG TPA: DUF4276 family protein [Pirellulales bacterium]|nr:DUF4276 family protein [Pirellulales bacterium]
MKFILLVEGATEHGAAGAFLKRWLDLRLSQPVGIETNAFDGYAALVKDMPVRARMHLEGARRHEIVAVVALLDLYGPTFYPPDKTSANERYDWGKQHFEREVGLDKFRLFFAVHEFEAWLLSDPAVFPTPVKNALPRKIAHPERVNFGEPPSRLLDRTYRRQMNKGYKKTVHGRKLFAKLDPDVATQKCPHLKELLEEMLRLAHDAGLRTFP